MKVLARMMDGERELFNTDGVGGLILELSDGTRLRVADATDPTTSCHIRRGLQITTEDTIKGQLSAMPVVSNVLVVVPVDPRSLEPGNKP